MKHQPRGFASYVGAPQHIWCPYDRLHQPRGFASCLKSKLAAAAWIYTHPDLRLRNHGVPSFFLIIKSFIRVSLYLIKKNPRASQPWPAPWREYTHADLRYHGVPSFFLIIKSFIRARGWIFLISPGGLKLHFL